MSIENFSKIYPDTDNLRSIMASERMVGLSSVACLARNFAFEAGSGLRELSKGVNINRDSSVSFALDQNSFVGVPRSTVNNIVRHHIGVIYGASIVELEHAMIEGYFDVVAWCSLYNLATVGTMLAQMKAEEGKSVENLSREDLQKMRQFSRDNKTYSGFFTKQEGFALLPKNLQTVFSQGNILSVVKSEIIPVFEPRAALLIASTKVIVGG